MSSRQWIEVGVGAAILGVASAMIFDLPPLVCVPPLRPTTFGILLDTAMVLLEVEGVRIESEERRCSLTRPAGPNFLFMLRPSAKLEEIDRRHARERLARRSYTEALAVFAALWREAAALDPDFPGPWRDDLEADLAVARAVNALPPDA